MGWKKLVITADQEEVDFISEFLLDRGALSVTLQDAGSQDLFQEELGETPLWKKTEVHAFFDKEFFLEPLLEALVDQMGENWTYQTENVADENWIQKTQENFPPQLFGARLWVVPPWHEVSLKAEEVSIVLNPGLGFGTGAHPTTALCLSWLSQQNLTHKTVIDYGCGSGILALAACALGAQGVWAVDHDPQAILATKNNAQLNNFNESLLNIVLPDQLPKLKADIILANILANPLCALAPQLIDCLAPCGFLILSGFLVDEIDRISVAYVPQLTLAETITKDHWVQLIFFKPNKCNAPIL